MPKPRVFMSSTCYDLKDARAAIETHLQFLEYEPIRSDTGKFGVSLKKHSHDACLDQVEFCDYFLLIIGGRRGGTYVGSEKSITNEEYNRARKLHKPIITFVRQEVMSAFHLYKRNPSANFAGTVDDTRVFQFLETVTSSSEDNWVREFTDVEEIKEALTSQFAYISLLYSQQLVKAAQPRKEDEGEVALARFPKNLNRLNADSEAEAAALTRGLRVIHETIHKIQNSLAKGKNEKLKLLWVFGRYGEVGHSSISMSEPNFRQYAWGMTKGRNVFEQMKDFGIRGDYPEPDDYDLPSRVVLWFKNDDNADVAIALTTYVHDLLKAGDDDWLLHNSSVLSWEFMKSHPIAVPGSAFCKSVIHTKRYCPQQGSIFNCV